MITCATIPWEKKNEIVCAKALPAASIPFKKEYSLMKGVFKNVA